MTALSFAAIPLIIWFFAWTRNPEKFSIEPSTWGQTLAEKYNEYMENND